MVHRCVSQLFLTLFFMIGVSIVCASPTNVLQAVLTPITSTIAEIPVNGSFTVQYQVINNSTITRPFVVTPIVGMAQILTGNSVCANPFILSPGQSCLLTLNFSGRQIANTIMGGPQVCKIKRANDNSTGTSLCMEPATGAQLKLTKISAENAGISTTPAQLSMMVDDDLPQVFTVSNLSNMITAYNVMATLPHTWADVTQDASDCLILQPLGTCQLEFTPGKFAHGFSSITISGVNAATINAVMSINSGPLLSLNSSSIVMHPGVQASLTIQNISNRPITNIHSVFDTTPLSGVVSESSNTCSSLNVNQQCMISYMAKNIAVAETTFKLIADNVEPTSVFMSVNSPIAIGSVLNDGIIFDINPDGSGGKIVTSIDIASASPWGGFGITIGGVAENLSDGSANSAAIVNELSNNQSLSPSSYAAGICSNYVSPGGVTDWYLPAVTELQALWSASQYNDGPILGLTANVGYWSSTEMSAINSAWFANILYFGGGLNGTMMQGIKSDHYFVRCVRTFP